MPPTDKPVAPASLHSASEALQAVPVELYMPATAGVPPPVETLQQLLPVYQLAWENVERLCVRMARIADCQIDGAWLYGTPGQAQDGIDVFARGAGDPKYTVYQCKRLATLTSATLDAVVDTFANGRWAAQTSTFILFTSHSAVRTELRLEIESQRTRLALQGISFEVWDSEEISRRLKTNPEIVLDFFGRAWTAAFCTVPLASLERRLDAHEVAAYRKSLRAFYGHVFDRMDPGLPIRPGPGVDPIPLLDRYEPLDVRVREKPLASPIQREQTSSLQANADAQPPSQIDRDTAFTARRNVIEWLASAERSIVLGGPGSGKSTLLRCLGLDLLSEAPSLANVNPAWAGRLPVWLPFAYWTRLIVQSGGRDVALTDCLQHWFEAYGKIELFELVKAAIHDERLLLLVDGLDEWETEAAGHVASHLLHVFVEDSSAALVVSSRPYGADRLPTFFGTAWQQAYLAPLSLEQQTQLCTRWFTIRSQLRGAANTSALPDPAHETARFLGDLSRSHELHQLATEPLLLLILLFIWFQGNALPRRRFDAYDEIIKQLLEAHPAARRESALVATTTSALRPSEVRAALGFLSFAILRDNDSLTVSTSVVRTAIQDFLEDNALGLGLSRSAARGLLDDFSEIAEGSIGILVRQGFDELGFLHRSFQEYLAAEHLSRLPLSEQLVNVRSYGDDPRWREVIVGLCWHTSRPDDVRAIIDELQAFVKSTPRGLAIAELLAELAFGDFHCPAVLARDLAATTMNRIEQHGWLPHRRRLLGYVLDGLRSTIVRAAVEQRLQSWIFSLEGGRSSLYSALRSWPKDADLQGHLIAGLYDEDPGAQRAAARSLAGLAAIFPGALEALATVVRSAPAPLTRAAALEAAIIGWPASEAIPALLDVSRTSASPEVRLVGMRERIRRGEREGNDFPQLLHYLRRDAFDSLSYEWRHLVGLCLVEGWSGDAELLSLCLSGLRQMNNGERIAGEALDVLVNGFSRHPEVARYLADELHSASLPFVGSDRFNIFQSIADAFRDDQLIVEAFDAWLAREPGFHVPEVCFAARAGRTPAMKARLLAELGGQFPHWPARTLLEEWGLDDADVRVALLAMAATPRAARIAHLLPQLLPNEEAERRLHELLLHGPWHRVDFVLEGLHQLPELRERDAIISASIEAVKKTTPALMLDIGAFEALLYLFPDDERVRKMAIEALAKPDAPHGAIAGALGNDPEVRAVIAPLLHPLPKALRVTLVEGLAAFPDPFAVSTLGRYWEESDEETRVLGSVRFHRMLPPGAPNRADALVRLELDRDATGPFFHSRRRASFAGLVALHEVELPVPGEPLNGIQTVGLSDYFKSDVPLARVIAEEWDYLDQVYQQRIEEQLSSSGSQPFWATMSSVAADFPKLRARLDEHIAAIDPGELSPEYLRFLERAHPKSILLKDVCLKIVRGRSDSTRGNFQTMRIAAAALATNFRGDPDVLRLLLTGGVDLGHSGIIMALASGWPETETLDRLYDIVVRPDRPPVSYSTYYDVTLSRVPVEAFVDKYLELIASADEYLFEDLRTAVFNRLSWDGVARQHWATAIMERDNRHLIGTGARVLRAIDKLVGEARAFCERFLIDQPERAASSMTLDLIAEQVRPLQLVLLDAVA